MSLLEFDQQLQDLREKSIDRLLCADVFDVAAFDALFRYLNAKAGLMRSEYAISKQVLSCLRDAQSAITSRAEYLPSVTANMGVAQKFALLLDLMIIGETLEDRRPTEPRIV